MSEYPAVTESRAAGNVPRRAEIRAAADHMLQLMDDVRNSEETKRTVPLGSEAFVELALRVATNARVVSRWADLQLQLAQSMPYGVEDVTIADVQPRRLERVLALWREAQIRLELAPPGSAASAKAVEDIERLRNEYQAGFELRHEADADELDAALTG
jgi:hypothetical protein